ncbi:alpha-ketoglutarate-dependent dioxygenase AlkB [Glaciecola sp. SC05]|uniref:alpha-ketoglutarate-dependent dioxygenase AlkB family protein n=1 Tax=Glaciecola sp. SC05 TaxID=1987355 RepID=UPI0035279ACC
MQKALFESEYHDLKMPDAEVCLVKQWIKPDTAHKLLHHFKAQLAWSQPEITLFGKRMKVPRLQAWYGDADAGYSYSGLMMEPLPWEDKLFKLKEYCEQSCQTRFNSVLVNLYRDGQDSMGMHADNEPELGVDPVIASVSLGATRNFDFKHKQSSEKRRIALSNGSLLIMRGSTQQYWQHGISKTKKVDSERINFTFRYVLPASK